MDRAHQKSGPMLIQLQLRGSGFVVLYDSSEPGSNDEMLSLLQQLRDI